MEPSNQPIVEEPANPPVPVDLLPPAPSSQPAYRDRSGWLVAFGIVLIVVGGLVALGIPFLLLGALLSRKAGAGMPPGTYVMSVVSYGLGAAVMITLGVGSIRARRWAHALTLILSWAWLLFGVMSTVLLTAVLPTTFVSAFHKASAMNPNATDMPTGVLAVILTFIIVLFSIFLVVLPLAFLLFYRRQDVKETGKSQGSGGALD